MNPLRNWWFTSALVAFMVIGIYENWIVLEVILLFLLTASIIVNVIQSKKHKVLISSDKYFWRGLILLLALLVYVVVSFIRNLRIFG